MDRWIEKRKVNEIVKTGEIEEINKTNGSFMKKIQMSSNKISKDRGRRR